MMRVNWNSRRLRRVRWEWGLVYSLACVDVALLGLVLAKLA